MWILGTCWMRGQSSPARFRHRSWRWGRPITWKHFKFARLAICLGGDLTFGMDYPKWLDPGGTWGCQSSLVPPGAVFNKKNFRYCREGTPWRSLGTVCNSDPLRHNSFNPGKAFALSWAPSRGADGVSALFSGPGLGLASSAFMLSLLDPTVAVFSMIPQFSDVSISRDFRWGSLPKDPTYLCASVADMLMHSLRTRHEYNAQFRKMLSCLQVHCHNDC